MGDPEIPCSYDLNFFDQSLLQQQFAIDENDDTHYLNDPTFGSKVFGDMGSVSQDLLDQSAAEPVNNSITPIDRDGQLMERVAAMIVNAHETGRQEMYKTMLGLVRPLVERVETLERRGASGTTADTVAVSPSAHTDDEDVDGDDASVDACTYADDATFKHTVLAHENLIWSLMLIEWWQARLLLDAKGKPLQYGDMRKRVSFKGQKKDLIVISATLLQEVVVDGHFRELRLNQSQIFQALSLLSAVFPGPVPKTKLVRDNLPHSSKDPRKVVAIPWDVYDAAIKIALSPQLASTYNLDKHKTKPENDGERSSMRGIRRRTNEYRNLPGDNHNPDNPTWLLDLVSSIDDVAAPAAVDAGAPDRPRVVKRRRLNTGTCSVEL